MTKKTLEEVVADLKAKHPNDGYDYTLITKENYINTQSRIPIICPVHGVFYQTPEVHLKGCGCPKCGHEKGGLKKRGKIKKRKKFFGVGINDVEEVFIFGKEPISLRKWTTMLSRCYSEKYHKNQPTYVDCEVCDEWKYFSNFKKWHDKHYVEGYELDKDLLIHGNKVYSPNACCYIPKYINTLILGCKTKRGDLPIGVVRKVGRLGKVTYIAQMSNQQNSKKRKSGHIGSFATIEEAFAAYKEAKEKHIKQVAQEYYDAGKIAKRVYDALMNYKVEITD